ncbi:MAG: glycosyltransferase family 39 protein [Actinobacteria bacterium]|nr:glycosyltransferase family 39 protein [Actinomycetota bacterium]
MVLLVLLVAGSTALRAWAGSRVPGPWIMPDEAIYGELGQSLYRSGTLDLLGGPTAFVSLLYPALVGLPLSLAGLEDGYVALKALQALVMSLAAVPVYLWGRSLMPCRFALAAAALALAVPGLAYSGLLMSEVLFYPVLVTAAWAMAAVLEHPTLARQALLVAMLAAAAATRLQALVLVPILLTAVLLKLLLDRDLRTARALTPILVTLAGLASAWSAWRLLDGGSWAGLLGIYASVASGSYDVGNAARFSLYHLGDLLLLTGVVPAGALILLATETVRARESSPALRAFVAVAVSLSAWVVVEVGVFASRYVQRLAERNLLGLAPLLFLALMAWIARGAPRPRIWTSALALLLLLPLLALPLNELVSEVALPDAFAIVPLYRLAQWRPGIDLELVVAVGGAVLLAAFALLPRRLVGLLPAALAAALAGASVAASDEVAQRSRYDHERLLGGERAWIDAAASGPAVYLYAGESYWNGVWQQVFWSRRLRAVYTLPGTEVPGPLPQEELVSRLDGRLTLRGGRAPDAADYAVASASHTFVGTPVARIQQRDLDQAGLVLWRLRKPMRLSSVVTGVRPDGDMYEPARLRAYDCGGGELRLTLIAKSSTRVELRRDGALLRTLAFRSPSDFWIGTVPGPPRDPAHPVACLFEVRGNSLLGSTRFEFGRPG